MIAGLAFRNLRRNPRRSVLTATSIIAGIGFLILGQAFVDGVEENIIVAAEEGTTSHLIVRPAGYPVIGTHAPLDKLVELTPQARALLDQEAVAWAGRIRFTPLAIHGADSVRVRATAYDPVKDPQVFPRAQWRLEGQEPAADGDELTVSPSVARLLSLKPGDRLVLQVRTHTGAINALEAKVSGIRATGNMALDQVGILVPWALAARLTNADAPTHVSVKLKQRADADAFKPRLLAALGPQAEAATLDEETRELVQTQRVRQKMLNVVVFILMALAAFGMANTFLMAAYERTREVGTLRAMGMTEGGVVRLFIAEGVLVGLFASLLGAAWGGWLAWHWNVHPIDFGDMVAMKANGNFAINALLGTKFSAAWVLKSIALGLVVSALASWYPARVASGLRPADAVRA